MGAGLRRAPSTTRVLAVTTAAGVTASAAASCSANERAEGGRSAGSFDIAARMTASTPAGTPWATSGGGGSSTMRRMTATIDSSAAVTKGGWPVMRWWVVEPSEYTSLSSVADRPSMTSGET